MNWFIVAIVILFFTVAILTSDHWLDKFFGTKPMTWDETQDWLDLGEALAPYERAEDRFPPGSVIDFRRPRNWDDEAS